MRVVLWPSVVAAISLWPARAWAVPLEELIESARGSVAHLSIRDSHDRELSSGSGFVLTEDGKLATNYHVVSGASRVVAIFSGGKEVEVMGAWAFDIASDLAIVQLGGRSHRSLKLAPTPPKQGTTVVVIGSPRGLQGTVSTGIVSAVREDGVSRGDREKLSSWGLQISAPISPGSSGSPVLDTEGQVVGVAVGTRLQGEALNFAVPVSRLERLAVQAEAASSLQPLPRAPDRGRSVRMNLAISAVFVFALMLLWWLLGRRGPEQARKRSLERFGIRE